MGKKDKKKKSKDPEKKAELQAKKEAKAEKAARKRFDKEVRKNQQSQGDDDDENDGDVLVRDDGHHDDEDDLDALLSSYAKKDKELTTPIIHTLGEGSSSTSPFPSPRANFSMTLLPNNDLLMFGGEYYDGAENIVYDDLYQWNPDAKRESDEDDAGPQKLVRNHGATTSSSEDENDELDNNGTTTASEGGDESDDEKTAATNNNNIQHHGTKSSMLPQSMSPSRSSALSSTNKGIWKQIISPHPRPNARCAHSAVLYRDCIYVFGGELATTDQFHHYRDFWCYNIKTRLWEELKPLGLGPSARSGHRCIVWRNYMILFGGFYEALRETPRWYNDLWVYNFATNTWKECKYSKLATIPDPRSGFVFGLNQSSPNADTAFLYGGFSKVKNPGDLSEGKVHTDTWALHLKPLLQQQQQSSSQQDSSTTAGNSTDGLPTWNRLTRKGDYPSPRVSVSGISHKHRLLLFGGVLDEEKDHHTVNSIFYDDLFHLDMEKRRWYALHLKTKPQPAPSEDTDGEIIEQQKKFRRRKKKSSTTPSSSSSPSSAAIHKSSHHRRATRHPARGAPPELKEEEEEDDTEQQQGATGNGDDSKEKTKEKKNEKGDDDEEQDDGSGDENEEGGENAASSKGWDLEMLQTNMSSFVDGEGNVVYEKIKTRASTKHHPHRSHDKQEAATTTGGNHRRLVSDSTEAGYSTGYDADEGGFSSALEQSSVISMSAAEEIAAASGTVPSAASESVLKKPFITSLGGTSTTVNAASGTSDAVLLATTVGSSTMSRRTAPLPRIKPALVVRGGNTLLVYGGLVEVGDREVTLDDVWTLDLSKRDKWNCIYEGTMSQQVWKGVTSDDEDSYVSGGAASGMTGNDLDDDDDDNEDDDDDSYEEDENEEVNEEEGAGADESKEEKARKKKEALREEMEQLKNEMSTKVDGNVERLPLPQESMADYYGRTKEMWIEVVKKAPTTDSKDEMSAKELKTASFAMARELYEEVVPTIERLEEMQNKLHKHKKKKPKKTDEGGDDDKKQKRKKKADKDHATAAVSAVPRDRRKNRAK